MSSTLTFPIVPRTTSNNGATLLLGAPVFPGRIDLPPVDPARPMLLIEAEAGPVRISIGPAFGDITTAPQIVLSGVFQLVPGAASATQAMIMGSGRVRFTRTDAQWPPYLIGFSNPHVNTNADDLVIPGRLPGNTTQD